MFVSIEGIDGSGKTTLASLVHEKLQARGEGCIMTKPLGGDDTSMIMRDLLLNPAYNLEPDSAPFVFIADMNHVAKSVILPAIAEGKHVICDRYTATTWAYQIDAVDHLKAPQKKVLLEALQRWIPAPDLTVILDISTELAFSRIKAREEANGQEYKAPDVYEAAEDLTWDRRRLAYLSYHKTGLQEESNILMLYMDKLTEWAPEDIADLIVTYVRTHALR